MSLHILQRQDAIKIGVLASLMMTSVACQEVDTPSTVLTRQQWERVQKHLLKSEPTPQHKLNIDFGDQIELIGLDVSGPLEAGKEATLTWYWRAKQDIKADWRIFVHFDSQSDKSYRQNLDHHPVDEIFRTSKWKKDMIIEDVQKVRLNADWPKGEAIPYIGLYRGQERLPVVDKSKQDGVNRAIGPKLEIVSGAAPNQGGDKASKNDDASFPRYAARSISSADAKLTVDGELNEAVWNKLPVMRLGPLGNAPAKESWAKLLYTEDALYIAAYLQDEQIWGSLKDRDSDTWNEEVFEVFIDPDGDGADYLELQVTPNNVIFDAHFLKQLGRGEGSRQEQIDRARAFNLEGLQSAVKIDGTVNKEDDEDKSWTIELKLPFAKLPGAQGKAPTPGQSWSVNLYRFDRPRKGQTFAYAWSTQASRSFHEVAKYGKVQFMASLPTVPQLDSKRLMRIDPRKLEPVGPIRALDPKLRKKDR